MPWSTERRGDPLKNMSGWGIDGYDDIPALYARLSREERQGEWTLDYIAPLKPLDASTSYYDPKPDPRLPAHVQRNIAAAADRRSQFLRELAGTETVKEACEKVGVTVGTVAQWRKRFPDFRNKYTRIRSGLPESEEVNDSFVSRRRYYFGYETYTHHQAILDGMEDTPDGGITLILVGPESGKTQTLQDWICDKIAQDPDVRITYVSESTEDQSPAMKVLAAIKERMTDPDSDDPDTNYPTHTPEWINRFGPFRDDVLDKSKPWNRKYIKVHKAGARRDYTFQACSWRSRIYGSRCDWMIFDDVQSDESLPLSEKMLTRFSRTFFNRPGKNGKIVFIGTRVGVGDVYELLVERIPEHMIRIVQIPALDEHGNSYCPEMWPIEALEDRRSIVGEDGWLTAYMMAPQAAGVTTFTMDLLDAARDNTRLYGTRAPVPVSLILAGIDPALGGGNALVAAQVTSTHFHILAAQVDYGLARNEDIFMKIRSFCRYRFTELVVERNSQQRGLARDERLRDMAKLFGFRIVEHETGKNKWDYAFGVASMASSFIRKEITFPDGDKETRRLMEPLRAELLAWRPNVDPKLLRQDLVMALWFTWLIWMQRRKTVNNDTSWNMGGTPWSPGDMSGRWGRNRTSRSYPQAVP